MYTLLRQQQVNIPAEELWAFIATPVNLNLLTPPSLQFKFLSELPETMSDGLLLLYEVGISPFGRWRWLTEIKYIRPGISFVDEQRLGPYRFWYHYHEIAGQPDGSSLMLDRVCYQLPFGPLGALLHRLMIRRMLEQIFDYRATQMRELFP